jgi:hypothetical protein
MDPISRGARRQNELVTGVGNEGRSGVADQRDRFFAELGNDPLALGFAAVIVVAAHRHFCADVGQQLGRHARILGKDSVGVGQSFRRARAEVAEVADWGRDDVQSGRQ